LIPGAGGAASYWHRLVPELGDRGHEAIAVDLPADDDSAGLAEYTNIAVEAFGGRDDLVLVAQSMGGFTAPLVATRLPVSMIVLVNAMIPVPHEPPGDWWTKTGQAEARREMDARDGRGPDAPFDPFTYFLHDIPPEVIEALGVPPEQSDTPFERPWPLDAWPDVPTRAVTGRDDRFFPAEFQKRVAEERLGITPDLIPGGHLPALSHPRELADLLESYRG
jgi:pimeloyl-ACP methyl ester carboxylesterase